MLRKSLLALFSSVALYAGSHSAIAADTPVKTRAPSAAYRWAGFYIGGTAGAAWSAADTSLDTVNDAGVLYRPGDIPLINALGSSRSTVSKAIFGAKIGYNWQWGSYVAGIEGDFSSFRFANSASPSGNPFLSAPPYLAGFANFETNVSSNWLATVRGRLGYAHDKAYFYGTAGAAFSRVSFSNTYVAQSPLGLMLDVESSSATKTKVGWAVGAGVDYALSANWIASVEYLHVDLGSLDSRGVTSSTGGGTNTAALNYSTKLTSDIVRAGIAYKF
jgi:outer membrane immunogenic protein